MGDARECAINACAASQASAGDPVDTRSGNFDYSLVDLSLQTLAGPLTFQRSYASLALDTDLHPTSLSPGWTHNQDVRLIFEPDQVWFKGHTLNQYRFTDNGDGTFSPYAGVLANLAYDSGAGTYTLTGSDQSTYTFSSDGLLQTWRNEPGYGFDYSYQDGQLYRVTEPVSGRYLQFTYQDGRLTGVGDHSGRQVSFVYSGGDLTSFSDARGETWTYAYQDHRLTAIQDPDGQPVLSNLYDEQGRVSEQFNGAGERIVKLIYNGDGSATILDALERASVDAFDGRGVRVAHTDPAGYATDYAYDENFRLVRATDEDERETLYAWSGEGANLTGVQDAEGYVTLLEYDGQNHLTQVTDPRGQVLTYTYDGPRLESVTRQTVEWGEIVSAYAYTTAADAPQPEGLLKSVSDDLGNLTQLTYDDLGQLVTIEDALGAETHFAYDSLGRVTEVSDPRGVVTRYEYDPAGNPTRVIRNDLPGQPQDHETNLTTEFVYDGQGRLTQVLGYLSESQAIPTTVSYDAAGRVAQTLDALNNAATYSYLPTGQVETVTDALNHTTGYGYDAAGRLEQVTDGLGRVVERYSYNPDGSVAAVATPVSGEDSYVVSYQYDGLGRVTGITDNNSYSLITSYDAYGNPIEQIDGLGRVTVYGYNELGLLAQVIQGYAEGTTPDADTNVLTTYAYNALGQLTGVTDANNHTRTYGYDEAGRLLTETGPLGHVTSYSYDANGNLATLLDANGNLTSFAYDPLDRLTAIDYPGDTQDVALGYDGLGRLTGMDDGLGHTGWSYDDLGRVTEVTDPFGQTVGYGWDATSNLAGLSYPGGPSIGYQYNAADQLTRVTEGAQTWAEYSYDETSGRLTMASLGNGLQSEYEYDLAGQLSGLRHHRNGAVYSAYVYQYDEVGKRVSVEERFQTISLQFLPTVMKPAAGQQGQSQSAPEGEPEREGQTPEAYPADPRGYPAPEAYPAPKEGESSFWQGMLDFLAWLLTDEVPVVYAQRVYPASLRGYPPPGTGGGEPELPATVDRTITYTYDDLDRLIGASYSDGPEYAYTYDPVGNRLSQTANGVTTGYVYDAADRLTSVNGAPYTWDDNGNLLSDGVNTYSYDYANRLNAIGNPLSAVSFGYDGLGNRYQQTVDGQTTTYTLEQALGLSQVLSDGTNTYLYGLDRLAQQNTIQTDYYLPDALGSVRQMVDGNRHVSGRSDFDPFGGLIATSGSGSVYGYTGEQTTSTDLLYLRARTYDTATGRFLSQDPFGGAAAMPSTLNAYVYGVNNPILHTDPSGELAPILAAMLVSGALSGGLDLVGQLILNSGNIHCIDWAQFAGSVTAGVVGGIIGFYMPVFSPGITGLVKLLFVGGMTGMAGGLAARTVETAITGDWGNWQQNAFSPSQIGADFAFGAIGSGIGYGIQRGLAGIAQDTMQGLTNSANRNLGKNLPSAKTVLSRNEYLAGQTYPSVARMEYGNAVERMVGRTINDSSILSRYYRVVGGPNKPDFIGIGPFKGLKFDITTNTTRSISTHLSRSYGNGLILITYLRSIGFSVFP